MKESSPYGENQLKILLDRANLLRMAGREKEAIAYGPQILAAYFYCEQGYELPRENPSKFTEKLYCRMLDTHIYGCKIYSKFSDKFAVRDYVAKKVGEKYLSRLIWRGKKSCDIPWAKLPSRSVLKCNEGSRKILFLDQSSHVSETTERCEKWLAESYYWFRREYHYLDVPRELQIEEFLSDGHPDGPLDYIFFCFDGIPRIIQIGSRSHTIHRFFSTSWEPLKLSYREVYQASPVSQPVALDEMLEVAAQLSAGFDFVRIDLYCCHGQVRFGEMTFTPRAGKLPFTPQDWDEKIGLWWNYTGVQNIAYHHE